MRKRKALFSSQPCCSVRSPSLGLAQTPYSQDFEALAPVDGSLAGDGWLNYGNVFTPAGGYIYGYGPMRREQHRQLAGHRDRQGGVEQGAQQLVVYSDYQNGNHGAGNIVESTCTGSGSFRAAPPAPGSSPSTPRWATSAAARPPWRSSRTLDPRRLGHDELHHGRHDVHSRHLAATC